MRESEPTPVTERSKSYLAWRIFRYLAIQGGKGFLRLAWWLLVQSGRVIVGLGRLMSSPTPSYVNRARISRYGWFIWRR